MVHLVSNCAEGSSSIINPITGPPQPSVGSAPTTTSAGTHWPTFLVVAPPVYLGLVVQPEDQVGEQLEQVLPQQQRHVKVNVAYVRLADVSSVAHVAHARKLVDEVVAVASVLAGVGLALVQLLLTPADTEAARRSGSAGSETSGNHLKLWGFVHIQKDLKTEHNMAWKEPCLLLQCVDHSYRCPVKPGGQLQDSSLSVQLPPLKQV